MIGRKAYVKYNTLDSREEVENWFKCNEQVYSNRDNYQEAINRLNDFKASKIRKYGKKDGKREYRNIWGHQMYVMIPHAFHNEEDAMKFVKSFMISVNACYKTNKFLYCYNFYTQSKGMYANIICFTRKIYDKVKKKPVVWTSNYYWNPYRNQRSTASDIDAIKLHSKGEPKLDKKGNVIYEEIYVSPVEKRIFTYSSFNIKQLTDRLRSYVNQVSLELVRTVKKYKENMKKFLTSSKRIKNATRYDIARRYAINETINNINSKLNEFYDALIYGYLDDESNIRSFNKILYKINQTIYKNEINYQDNLGNNYYIYLGKKQKFSELKAQLINLEEYIYSLLEDWWETIFSLNVSNLICIDETKQKTEYTDENPKTVKNTTTERTLKILSSFQKNFSASEGNRVFLNKNNNVVIKNQNCEMVLNTKKLLASGEW